MNTSFRPFLLRVISGVVAVSAFVSEAAGAGSPKIGFLLKSRVGYWELVGKAAASTGATLGATLTVKGPPIVQNIGAQSHLLETLLQESPDVLVIAPIAPDKLQGQVEAARAKGTKVVVIDTPEWKRLADVYVDLERDAMCAAAAKLCATLAGDNDEVAIFRHVQSDPGVTAREESAIVQLKALKPNLVVHADVYASAVAGEETVRADFLLDKYPHVKVVLAAATAGTLTMLKEIQARQVAGKIKLVGFGTNLTPEIARALEGGALSGWVAQTPRDLGAKCIESAVALARGTPTPTTIDCGFLLVTRENLHEAKSQALLAE